MYFAQCNCCGYLTFWRSSLALPLSRGGPLALAAVAGGGLFQPFAPKRFAKCVGSDDEGAGPSSPAAAAKDPASCICCSLNPCICPKNIQGLRKIDGAHFSDSHGERIFWPRVAKKEDGKLYMSCFVCANFNAGITLHSNSKLRLGTCDVVKSKVCKTTVDDHVAKGPKGEHGQCVANYLAAFPKNEPKEGEGEQEEPLEQTRAAKRASQTPSKELLNHFAWLYTAVALPISANKFGKLMHVADKTNAEIVEGQYLGDHFFTNGLDCLNRVVSESVFKVLKKARKVAWHMDVGGGVLLIRFFALNSYYERQSHFVPRRTLGSHTAKAMFEGFLRSLTAPSKVQTLADVLSLQEVCEKSVVFLADGASSMGVRSKGKSTCKAVTGDNFFHLLQKKVDEVLGAGVRPVIGCWCDNHRIDVVASDCETKIAYVSDLLKFFRSVIAHIMQSDRAQGLLDYIAFLLEPPTESEEIIASSGSLSSVHFAPQRWLSTVKPMKALVEKMEHFLLYMLELSIDPRHNYQDFGKAMVNEFSDVRFHLVLPGLLDINMVMDEANRSLQPIGINIWAASRILKGIKSKLEDLVLRQKTDQTHKKRSKIIEAGLAWFNGDLKSKALCADPCYFEKALTKLKLIKGADNLHKVFYIVHFKDRVLNSAGAVVKMRSIEMKFDADMLLEGIAILRKYANVLVDGLDRRFVNTNLVDDGVQAFSLEYDHTRDAEPTDSLKRLAEHFGNVFIEFHKSWEHLQHEKETFIQDALQGAAISGLTRAGLRPTVVWPQILRKIDSNPESLKNGQMAKNALEDFLVIEPTNASVERDANIVRLVRDATGNTAEADLVDSRVRMKIEGPEIHKAIRSSKGTTEWHPLLHEAAKDFMVDRRLLRGTSAGKRMEPQTAEHKSNISLGRKKRRVGVVQDVAMDVRVGSASAAWDEELDPTEAIGEPVVESGVFEAMLEQDLDAKEFLSTEPPARGRGRGGGRGAGRGRGGVPMGPAAAELVQIEKLAAEAMQDQDSERDDE